MSDAFVIFADSMLFRVLSLQDYNTRLVVISTVLLGMAAGIVGSFAYLRKRAMVGDALGHATLPGVAGIFVLTASKHLGTLSAGALATGVLGVLCVIAIRRWSRVKEDAAIGIVLSVFFGAGVVLLSLAQVMETGDPAGLRSFIYGKAAAIRQQDARWIAAISAAAVVGTLLLFKEFRILCFDEAYAAAQGRRVLVLDLLLMMFVVMTTVVGLQAVGLILIVALLIIPAVAARFWTDSLVGMLLLAAVVGGLSGWLGSTISALSPRMPTGAIIVVCAGVMFFISMFCSPHRGLIAGMTRHWRLHRRIQRQHLLRALAECEELHRLDSTLDEQHLLTIRSWRHGLLQRVIRRARRAGLICTDVAGRIGLTPRGRIEARRVLRNHRLWEMYLIRYADIAASHVDRDADEVEHVLSEEIIFDLERALAQEARIPPSPHPLQGGGCCNRCPQQSSGSGASTGGSCSSARCRPARAPCSATTSSFAA